MKKQHEKRVWIYGIRSVGDKCGLAAHHYIKQSNFTVNHLIQDVSLMVWENPDIMHVYMIDDSRELQSLYNGMFRAKRDEKYGIIFKDFLESNGVEVWTKER